MKLFARLRNLKIVYDDLHAESATLKGANFVSPVSALQQWQASGYIAGRGDYSDRFSVAYLLICSFIHSLDMRVSFGSISTKVYSSLAISFIYSGACFGKYIISDFFADLAS